MGTNDESDVAATGELTAMHPHSLFAVAWTRHRKLGPALLLAVLAAGALTAAHIVRDNGPLVVSSRLDAALIVKSPAASRSGALTNATLLRGPEPLAAGATAATSSVPMRVVGAGPTSGPPVEVVTQLPETLLCPALCEAKGVVIRNSMRLEVGGGESFPNLAYRIQYAVNQAVTSWPTNGTEVQRTVWSRNVTVMLTEMLGRSAHALSGEVSDVRGTRDSGVYDVTYRVQHVRSVVPVTVNWSGHVLLRINTEMAASICKGNRLELRFKPRVQLGTIAARGASVGLLRLLAPMSAGSSATAFITVLGDSPVCAIDGKRMPLAGL